MISWEKYTLTADRTFTAKELGDAQTGGSWRGLELNINSISGTATVTLPLASVSKGRIVTTYITNTNAKTCTISRSGSDSIIDVGAAKNGVSTTADNTAVTVFCDGTRWIVIGNDSQWS